MLILSVMRRCEKSPTSLRQVGLRRRADVVHGRMPRHDVGGYEVKRTQGPLPRFAERGPRKRQLLFSRPVLGFALLGWIIPREICRYRPQDVGGEVKGEITCETKLVLAIQNTRRGWTSTRNGLSLSFTLEHPKRPKGITKLPSIEVSFSMEACLLTMI